MISESIRITLDGNEVCAHVAYKTSEVIAIYPITPATSMGEFADAWAAAGTKNIWGTVPSVTEMQSESGVSGAMHGALQTGALFTTFTSSQGLLLMKSDMFLIAAERLPVVLHVACRTVATHGMSIYCDHSDVMAMRDAGFAMLGSASVQEVQDMAFIAQVASLEGRIPFLHFFDGLRTSGEVANIELLQDAQMLEMLDTKYILAHRANKLTPNKPSVRGVVHGEDIHFQTREVVNPYYDQLPEIIADVMQRFGKVTAREYHTVEYYGAADAEHVMVIMCSGAETALETAEYLNTHENAKVGVIKIRLFLPFPKQHFLAVLPKTCKTIAVLDRTKEPGSAGEPLYKEVLTTISEASQDGCLPCGVMPKIIAGRYGLGSKEFTPGMVAAIFAELARAKSKNHFTIGIIDDVTHTSLEYASDLDIEPDYVMRAVFYGLGADGTVGANKNTAKIIGDSGMCVQGYFVYDSRKSGSKTISHLRFSPQAIHSEYLITHADFIACHQFDFIRTMNVLKNAADNATFLLNSTYDAAAIWEHLPRIYQEIIISKKIKFYVIDAYKIAKETGMGSRINTIMQTCFFAISNVLPSDIAIQKIKQTIQKTYKSKGDAVVQQNFRAVDYTIENLFAVTVPDKVTSTIELRSMVNKQIGRVMPDFVATMLAERGNELPVSALPNNSVYPVDTICAEKRNIALEIPVWSLAYCLQCGQCSIVCPHSTLRAKHYDGKLLQNAPKTFKASKLRGRGFPDEVYTLQVYPEDCTGCGICVEACPVRTNNPAKPRAINMVPKPENLEPEIQNVKFFETLPVNDPAKLEIDQVRGVQYLQPMFEFCGACAGCGESPYVKLISQLFGDRLIIANACGCSSVYGGQLPTSPWTVNAEGRGPAWSSSLFEDNAEYGLGFRLTADKHQIFALELLNKFAEQVGSDLVTEIVQAKQNDAVDIAMQRARVAKVKERLQSIVAADPLAQQLLMLADAFVKQSVWSIGGDGWAYDIGYAGLDHVLSSGRNINLLVMDTEVYSNTGGQASKATPRGATAKFAAQGKPTAKKDLGLIMMTYGSIYVASIALGANPTQAIKAIREAEAFDGPSLIIAYSHCIAHGIDMKTGLTQQKLAVKTGYWPLYRYNPDRRKQGLNPFQLDSEQPSMPFAEYAYKENRYKILQRHNPELAEQLIKGAEQDIVNRWRQYHALQV